MLKRLKEASTWAGIAALALSVSPFLPPPYHVCAQAFGALAGTLAGIIKEKGATA